MDMDQGLKDEIRSIAGIGINIFLLIFFALVFFAMLGISIWMLDEHTGKFPAYIDRLKEQSKIRIRNVEKFIESSEKISKEATKIIIAAQAERVIGGALIEYARIISAGSGEYVLDASRMARNHTSSVQNMNRYLENMTMYGREMRALSGNLQKGVEKAQRELDEKLNQLGDMFESGIRSVYVILSAAMAILVILFLILILRMRRLAMPMADIVQWIDDLSKGVKPSVDMGNWDPDSRIYKRMRSIVRNLDERTNYFR